MSTVTVPENKLAELQIKASQRDKLLEALEAIIDSGELPLCYSSPLVIKANKAISKAKGE